MSFWLTKSSGRDIEYIVLRHTLRNVNYTIKGVRFRDSYAVVEKDGKPYRELKSIPVLKASTEYPLIWLRKLKFITRPMDVKFIYGADVYVKYLKALEIEISEEKIETEKQEVVKHIEINKLCACKTTYNNELCKHDALDQSPSGYCLTHILEDPKLLELGIEVQKFIPKKDKYAYKEKIAEQLRKLKKDGKF